MALLRRNNGQVSGSIWPGFVDAMTALLLVLMFVLTIFMVVQFVLRETITGQDTELDSLSAQIAGLADALGLEQTRAKGLEGELSGLQDELQSAETEIAQQAALIGALTSEAEGQKARIASFEQQIAGLLGERDDLAGRLTLTESSLKELKDAQAKTLSEKEAVQLALVQARNEIDLQVEQARLAAAKREALEALVADLKVSIETKDTQISETQNALSEQEKQRLLDAATTQALRDRLKNSQDELTAMTLALDAKRKEAENTLTLLSAAELAKTAASEQVKKQLSATEKEAALLAQANKLLSDEKALSADSQRKIALLNQQTNALRTQLSTLQGLLDSANTKDSEAQIQIESLGKSLNSALAKVAAEQKRRAELEANERERLEAEAKDLKKFKSEFFGRLRDVLGAQEGIRIVGDRFVFSSEVLYTAGSAELGDRGKQEIRKVASLIKDVAAQIPSEIDWILRVDGHTDKVPLSGAGPYRDNWELSQARALSVVRYLVEDQGIPANRLAANGFGEFQPVVDGESSEALALNRRIELKFTEK
ncbi:peptidoglycan -binding protein [Amylibacter sp. SFDW26]|uniref:peptidoglycan -binding protein n=1 Tax=Amylibacter sp. SFDW26 TaxID=2652722 RepID=UPI0012626279|nr:peptidoglycan -binding protein [Amylibacter sp. SFDW26]KAB7610463.1 peptidoglycan -binding protein [Amylibacter sp. SFDW26]